MADTLMIRCPACGALNRLPGDKVAQGLEPVCGRCKTPLPVREPVAVTDATFAADVENSEVPVLVDMWAEWCGPCRFVAPVVDEIARETAGRLRVMKMNVDENPATASRFNIRGIPALLVFKNGREVERIVGAQPKSAILSRLQPVLHANSNVS
jgi:thioredoxin 2